MNLLSLSLSLYILNDQTVLFQPLFLKLILNISFECFWPHRVLFKNFLHILFWINLSIFIDMISSGLSWVWGLGGLGAALLNLLHCCLRERVGKLERHILPFIKYITIHSPHFYIYCHTLLALFYDSWIKMDQKFLTLKISNRHKRESFMSSLVTFSLENWLPCGLWEAFLHFCMTAQCWEGRRGGGEVWHMNNWSFICGALPWIAHHADQALTTYGDKTTFLDFPPRTILKEWIKMFPSPKMFCPSHCHARRSCKTMAITTKEKWFHNPFLFEFRLVWINGEMSNKS